MEEVKKYKCKKCGVRTFQHKPEQKEGQIILNMPTINRLCSGCYDAYVLRIIDGIE